jgi:hypothetical protein
MVAVGEVGSVASEHLGASAARYGKVVKATGMKVD